MVSECECDKSPRSMKIPSDVSIHPDVNANANAPSESIHVPVGANTNANANVIELAKNFVAGKTSDVYGILPLSQIRILSAKLNIRNKYTGSKR